jgi:glutamate carboxypeptidase
MPRTASTEALYEVARRGAAVLGFGLTDEVSGGTSDANTLSAAGLTTLDGLGPVGGALHSHREYVDAASIVPRTALVAGLIARVASGEWTTNEGSAHDVVRPI